MTDLATQAMNRTRRELAKKRPAPIGVPKLDSLVNEGFKKIARVLWNEHWQAARAFERARLENVKDHLEFNMLTEADQAVVRRNIKRVADHVLGRRVA